MLNHSSATPHTIKSKSVPGVVATGSQVAKTLNGNVRSKKTDKRSVPGAVATGYQVTKSTSKTTISNALKRRAQAVINDRSIDAESRAIIRYGLETNDPLLPELVRRIDAGETIIETIVVLEHPKLTSRTRMRKRSNIDEMICLAAD